MWPAIIAGVSALASTALGVREARKARDWEERMSNTAHQREVRDMMQAGINPIMSASGGPGASTPQMPEADFSGIEKGVGNALMVRQLQAQIDLTRSQSEAASAQALKARVEAADIGTQATAGRYREISARADLAELDVRQREALFDTVIAQARAQLDLTTQSARGAKARAVLDELDKARAMNAQQLEQWLKGGTPGVRVLLDILRSMRR